MSNGKPDEGFSKERAELFEALGHPMRLEILRTLSESPLGFADLKRKVNVTSSGHLTHHLEKLGGLVRTTPEGLYALTDEGKEALRIVSISKESASDKVQNGKKLVISRAVLAGLVAALLLLASVAVIQELELTDLGGKQSSQNQPFPIATDFNSSVLQVIGTPLTPVISQGQNVTVSVEVYNPLEQGIQTIGDPRGTSLNPCGGPSPVDAEIYLGYYTSNNISEGTPLVLNPEAYCLFSIPFTIVYKFYPHSDMAMVSSPTNGTTSTAEVRGLFSASGYYTYVLDPTASVLTARFQTFAPGPYTVLASDVWGHTTVCYFVVQGVGVGVNSPAPQTYFGYNGSQGYTLSLLGSPNLSWYQDAIVERTVTGVGVGVGIFINGTDYYTNATISFYANGNLVSTKDFSLSELADPYHPPSELRQYGSIGFAISTPLTTGARVTFAIHADGPLFVTTGEPVQGYYAYAASGSLGSTVPIPQTILNFTIVAFGEK
jgi:DNA-binding transcriptional ArsR family regulator